MTGSAPGLNYLPYLRTRPLRRPRRIGFSTWPARTPFSPIGAAKSTTRMQYWYRGGLSSGASGAAGGRGQDGGAEQGGAAVIVVHEPSVTGQARKVDFIIPIHGSV